MSNIVLNIVEPGSSTPPVPDTGLFTNGSSISSGEAPIIAISIVVILAILTTIALVVYYRKKKQGKTPSFFTRFKHNKSTTTSLVVLALLVSIGTVAGLLKLGANAEEADNAETQNNTSSLTVTTSDTELTIELSDEPVFAVLPVEVTVAESTPAGYTLTAYTENTNLISTTDSSKVIPMVTVDNEELAALEDNTYGLSLVKPESQEEETYTSLSTDSANPTFITDKDYEATEEDDVTTIYYGIYITPDIPYGTYTGSAINYEAELNTATVIYDGNGLYFNNNEEQTTNTMKYLVGITDNTNKYSHTPNLNDDGEVIDQDNRMYPTNTEATFVYDFPGAERVRIELMKTGSDSCGISETENSDMFFSFWSGSHPDYTAEANYESGVRAWGNTTGKYIFGLYATSSSVSTDVTGDAITLAYTTANGGTQRGCGSGYGYYAILTGYDADDNPVYLEGNSPIVGEYQAPSWDLPYKFLGWNTNKDSTSVSYSSAEDIESNASLTIGETTTLYAIWQYATNITFDGNGADGGEGMSDRLVVAGQSTYIGNYGYYTKTGYYFTGWNTEADGGGTSYAKGAPFTAPTDKSENLTLYAQWQRYTTITFNGNSGDGSGRSDINLQVGEETQLCNNGYFYKDGYDFTGWNTEADGSGTAYDSCANYTAPDEPVDITLYAQWEKLPTISDLTYMQDFASLSEAGKTSVLSSMTQSQQYTLKDSRDQKDYYISKLADGNIWMTQNLDFDIVNGGADLDSTNTDVPANWADAGNLTNTYNDTTWNSSTITPESYDPGDLYWNGALIYDQTTCEENGGTWQPWGSCSGANPTSSAGNIHYHIGNYYNWTAAVAMSDSSSYGDEQSGTDVDQSICPAGWRLPNLSENKSYQNLVNTQSLTAGTSGNIQNTPTYFVYGGNWNRSSDLVGSYGLYWSSVVKYINGVYQLAFDADGNLNPQYDGYRRLGYSLRCVAR